jgi:hypothetical protein
VHGDRVDEILSDVEHHEYATGQPARHNQEDQLSGEYAHVLVTVPAPEQLTEWLLSVSLEPSNQAIKLQRQLQKHGEYKVRTTTHNKGHQAQQDQDNTEDHRLRHWAITISC